MTAVNTNSLPRRMFYAIPVLGSGPIDFRLAA